MKSRNKKHYILMVAVIIILMICLPITLWRINFNQTSEHVNQEFIQGLGPPDFTASEITIIDKSATYQVSPSRTLLINNIASTSSQSVDNAEVLSGLYLIWCNNSTFIESVTKCNRLPKPAFWALGTDVTVVYAFWDAENASYVVVKTKIDWIELRQTTKKLR